eukprot:TRINITY_DN34520_c0_g1_i2.p1 TRINITY_DN34520_c0_g1~~TRINITY_DN34520_c0_g1_i2.p1  ORF type:complete len:570 (+),score=154.29 TRINITY_DN34520_c0_g1_i2:71-1711(+)
MASDELHSPADSPTGAGRLAHGRAAAAALPPVVPQGHSRRASSQPAPLRQSRGRGGASPATTGNRGRGVGLASPSRRRIERADFEVVPDPQAAAASGSAAPERSSPPGPTPQRPKREGVTPLDSEARWPPLGDIPETAGDLADMPALFSGSPYCDQFTDETKLLRDGKCFVSCRKFEAQGADARQVFAALYGDHANFLPEHHRLHGEYVKDPATGKAVALQMPRWESPPAPPGRAVGWRRMECITVVKAPWSMHTPLIEHHRYALFNVGGQVRRLVVHNSACTPDVVNGSCFRCEGVVIFDESIESGMLTVESFGMVVMIKSTLMRRIIESTGNGELRESYSDLVLQAEEALRQRAIQSAGPAAQRRLSVPGELVKALTPRLVTPLNPPEASFFQTSFGGVPLPPAPPGPSAPPPTSRLRTVLLVAALAAPCAALALAARRLRGPEAGSWGATVVYLAWSWFWEVLGIIGACASVLAALMEFDALPHLGSAHQPITAAAAAGGGAARAPAAARPAQHAGDAVPQLTPPQQLLRRRHSRDSQQEVHW